MNKSVERDYVPKKMCDFIDHKPNVAVHVHILNILILKICSYMHLHVYSNCAEHHVCKEKRNKARMND